MTITRRATHFVIAMVEGRTLRGCGGRSGSSATTIRRTVAGAWGWMIGRRSIETTI